MVFALFNVNRDGYIKKDELLRVLRIMAGQEALEEELDEIVNSIFEDIDLNQDGLIDFDEFKSVAKIPSLRAAFVLSF